MREMQQHITKTLFVLLTCILMNTAIYAGITGKIVGKIIDAESGQPLIGANIILEGTSLGASSGLDGNYFIINVPPGIYSVKATVMGYTPVQVENVRISIDLTTTVDLELKQTVLEAGETVTVTAERSMVQLDMTSSMASVGSAEIEVSPAQSVSGVLELQAGIVDASGIHIRGGRSGEVAYWVDGVATTDAFEYSSTAAVENSAVQELQVISGTFNAEYGQAMSGIINIITKDGSTDYHGSLKGYVGDYISADDQYSVMKRVTTEVDPITNLTTVTTETEDPLKLFNPSYDGEFSLSGPVPFLNNKVTFFTNGRYYSDEGYLYGREWFLPSGFPGDSSLIPLNPNNHWSALMKLTWRPIGNIKLSYSLNTSKSNRDAIYLNDTNTYRNYKYIPGGIPQSKRETKTHLLSMNHVLSPSTFYEVKINRMDTQYEQYVYKDLASPDWLVYVPADTANPEMTFDPTTDEGKAQLRALQEYGRQYEWIVDPENPDGYVHQDSAKTPISYSFYRSGNDLRQT